MVKPFIYLPVSSSVLVYGLEDKDISSLNCTSRCAYALVRRDIGSLHTQPLATKEPARIDSVNIILHYPVLPMHTQI